jgi:hypothetical protein
MRSRKKQNKKSHTHSSFQNGCCNASRNCKSNRSIKTNGCLSESFQIFSAEHIPLITDWLAGWLAGFRISKGIAWQQSLFGFSFDAKSEIHPGLVLRKMFFNIVLLGQRSCSSIICFRFASSYLSESFAALARSCATHGRRTTLGGWKVRLTRDRTDRRLSGTAERRMQDVVRTPPRSPYGFRLCVQTTGFPMVFLRQERVGARPNSALSWDRPRID